MTYIAYWFHAFSQMERVENAGRRVEKFVQNMQGSWEMQNSFEQRMRELLTKIAAQKEEWKNTPFSGSYAEAKDQLRALTKYKQNSKRKWTGEKSDLTALLGNIKTKMGTYRLRPYEPPAELRLEVLDRDWNTLTSAERKRSQQINETIRDIKNSLRRSFADKANDFALTLNTLTTALSSLDGEVDDQLRHVQRLSDNIAPLTAYLKKIEELDQRCDEANIEENDFTTYTYDELVYELSLVKSAVAKKLAFLDNQLVARDVTNLTPIQLEEFESVFRHFDRDDSNTLHEAEFAAALASLGLVYDEDEMKDVFAEVANRRGEIGFEGFIRFMVGVTEDQYTASQVFQSFSEVADGKPYVTEVDLRHSLIPDELIDDLVRTMPAHTGPDLREDREVSKYDYIQFMEELMGPDEADHVRNGNGVPGSPKKR
jgi:Ca2+-binding EF-hand superfamily protein